VGGCSANWRTTQAQGTSKLAVHRASLPAGRQEGMAHFLPPGYKFGGVHWSSSRRIAVLPIAIGIVSGPEIYHGAGF